MCCAYRQTFFLEEECLNLICDSDFSKMTSGSLFVNSILKWCILFGTDSNEYHWKNIVNDKDGFRKKLYDSHCGEEGWKYVHEVFTKARNEAIAHIQDGFPRPILNQNKLLISVNLLIEELKKISSDQYVTQFNIDSFFSSEMAKSHVSKSKLIGC